MGEVSEIESFLRFDGVPELSVTSRSSIFKYFRATAGVGPYSKAFFRYPFAHSYSRASTEVLFLVTFRDSPSTVMTTGVACPLAAYGGSISPW